MLSRFRAYSTAAAIWLFYKAYSSLWRFNHVRHPGWPVKGEPRLYAHWHGDELGLIAAFQGRDLAVMISRSKDGEMMQTILKWLGYRVVRGSSSKGGAGGLKGLIDLVRHEKLSADLAVDGPRGPAFVVKPGILKLAQETGLPIYPGAVAAGWRFVFKKAWNRAFLPYPGSRIVVCYGEAVVVPPDATVEVLEEKRQELERKLRLLKSEAEAYFDRTFFPTLNISGCSAGG